MKKFRNIILSIVICISCIPFFNVQAEEDPSSYETEILPEILSDYAYLYDVDTRQILFDKNSKERMYPASMTKMMTVILAIENIPDPESTVIPFTQEMLDTLIEQQASRAGFLPGDEPTALDYMYGAMLSSGADCTRALAYYLDGSEEAFAERMNQKAMELCMKDTHFVNASGLHDDHHYSTCRDMGILMEYCMQNSLFREISSSRTHISVSLKHFPDGLFMENAVLKFINTGSEKDQNFQIPGFICGKSGYTLEGLYTMASRMDINSMKFLLVTGHAYVSPHYQAEMQDASTIAEWYRKHYDRKTAVTEGMEIGNVKVRGSFLGNVKAVSAGTITEDLPVDENLHIYFQKKEHVTAPVEKGEIVGKIQVYAYDRLVSETDAVAAKDVKVSFLGKANTFFEELSRGNAWLCWAVLAGILLGAFLGICHYHPDHE